MKSNVPRVILWLIALGVMHASAAAAGALWNYSVHMDMTINSPVAEVWSYFGEKKDKWAGLKGESIEYTTISGEPGKVGEIYTHSFLFHGYHMYYEAITVKPNQEIVLKITYNKNKNDQRVLAGYDLINLQAVGGKTYLDFQQAFELPMDGSPDMHTLSKSHDRELDDAFKELKHTIEAKL